MDKEVPQKFAGDLLLPFIEQLEHVGHVVEDLDAAIASFQALYGLSDSDIQRLPDAGEAVQAKFAFLEISGIRFELIQPVSEEQKSMLSGPPSAGGGLNHLAWRIRCLDQALDCLSRRGIKPGYVTPGGPVSLPGKRMVYLDPATTGGLLIELIEISSPS